MGQDDSPLLLPGHASRVGSQGTEVLVRLRSGRGPVCRQGVAKQDPQLQRVVFRASKPTHRHKLTLCTDTSEGKSAKEGNKPDMLDLVATWRWGGHRDR